MSPEFWGPLVATGVVVGFLAGLFGMGGGAIIIPALLFVFGQHHFDPATIAHQAVATSLGCILLGSISSLREHHAHGAVEWRIVRSLTPGIVAGGLLGPLIVAHLSGRSVRVAFMAFLIYTSINMLRPRPPAPGRDLPGPAGMLLAGTALGGISAMVGVGGAAISVPFMVWCNVRMHAAIGTSSALGFPIALAGVAGYIISGWGKTGLAPHSLGYVHLPSMLVLSAMSMLVAPLGARVAHRLPVSSLRKWFALLLIAITLRMAVGMF